MSKRAIEDALAHGEELRHWLLDPTTPMTQAVHFESDFVLLADEVARLRKLNRVGDAMLFKCSEENTELRRAHNEQVDEVKRLKEVVRAEMSRRSLAPAEGKPLSEIVIEDRR